MLIHKMNITLVHFDNFYYIIFKDIIQCIYVNNQ